MEPRCIIGHGVLGAWDIIVQGEVSVMTLMQGFEAE
jgi:hypothetical protein